jgi:hypothetical protein
MPTFRDPSATPGVVWSGSEEPERLLRDLIHNLAFDFAHHVHLAGLAIE